MDLVEIRKKAKSQKKQSAAEHEPVSGEPARTTEQEAPVEPEKAGINSNTEPAPGSNEAVAVASTENTDGHPEQNKAVESGPTVKEEDPLDALFSFRTEGGLATVEAYLQTLMEDDQVVDTDVEQWLTFSLGEEEYALTIEAVSEIIKPREVTDIPRVPGFISGIISLRGIIVPIFDLNKRLSLGTAELGSSARIIVCKDGDRMAGFIVDRINQVVNVPLKGIEPPPTVLSGLDRDFVEGVGRVDDRMLILLDLSNVMNAELV